MRPGNSALATRRGIFPNFRLPMKTALAVRLPARSASFSFAAAPAGPDISSARILEHVKILSRMNSRAAPRFAGGGQDRRLPRG